MEAFENRAHGRKDDKGMGMVLNFDEFLDALLEVSNQFYGYYGSSWLRPSERFAFLLFHMSRNYEGVQFDGIKEITLLGQNVNSYHDKDYELVDSTH